MVGSDCDDFWPPQTVAIKCPIWDSNRGIDTALIRTQDSGRSGQQFKRTFTLPRVSLMLFEWVLNQSKRSNLIFSCEDSLTFPSGIELNDWGLLSNQHCKSSGHYSAYTQPSATTTRSTRVQNHNIPLIYIMNDDKIENSLLSSSPLRKYEPSDE